MTTSTTPQPQPQTRTVQLPSSQPRRRRTGRVLLIGAAGLVVLGAGYTALGQLGQSVETTTASVAGVREIVVDADSGPIDLRGGTGPDVDIRTTAHRSLTGAAAAGHRLDGGVLTITAECPQFGMNCYVEEQITVPAGTPVRVRTSAGGVEAAELDVPSLAVDTSAGSVNASFVRPPQDVRITTSAGSVELRVPDAGYRVDGDTSAGTVRIGVIQDPSAPRSLYAESAAGNVTVLPR